MCYGRAVLLGLCCLFLCVSDGMGQTESEAQTVSIIKEIHESERKLRDLMDQRFGAVDQKFDTLDERVDRLEKEMVQFQGKLDIIDNRVSDLRGTLNLILGGIVTLIVSLVLSLIGYLTKPLWQRKTDTAIAARQKSDDNTANSNFSEKVQPNYR